MLEFFKEYLGEAIALLFGGLINWLFNKRKEKATVTSSEIDNGSKVVDLYKSALDDLPVRFEEKYKHLEEMSLKVEKLFEQKEKILLQEIEYHKKQAALYKKMYDDKVKEFNSYKKAHPAK
jgi:hypothetical protein